MSIICCDSCGEFIDSDDDPSCFTNDPEDNREVVWCEICREEHEQEMLEALGGLYA